MRFRSDNPGTGRLCRLGLVASLAALFTLPCLAGPVPGQGTWESTLHARDLDGDGVADADYDSVLGVTWLRDWSGSVPLHWGEAMAWADALDIAGHGGWRLPAAFDLGAPGCDWAMAGTDCGYNPLPEASELSHLFFVTLGNLSYYAPDAEIGDPAQAGWGISNSAHFTGMVTHHHYWAGTELAGSAHAAWVFTLWGFQGYHAKLNADGRSIRAVAVHDGDIGTPTAVPAPPSALLALAGLALLAASRMQRTAAADGKRPAGRLWDTAAPSRPAALSPGPDA